MNTSPVAPTTAERPVGSAPRGRLRRTATTHPVLLLLGVAIVFVWTTQLGSALAGVDLMPAKAAELLVLLGLAIGITRVTDGRGGVRRLFAGLLRWRIGWHYLVIALAMPVLTLGVAVATGTLHAPPVGWLAVGTTYLFFLALGAVTGNVWEETVWGGFVQGRLMARRGLLVGSLLTAVPFFLIHLPLAFEEHGWAATTWRDAAITWGVLLLAAPFQRYLVGMLLVDTGGSTLAAGLMHASVNAAGAMVVVPGGWQSVPALIVLTVAVAAHRRSRGALADPGLGRVGATSPAGARPRRRGPAPRRRPRVDGSPRTTAPPWTPR